MQQLLGLRPFAATLPRQRRRRSGSVVANALLFHVVQRYEVSRTTPYLFASPVVAIGLGAVILHDPITPKIALGAGLTIAGVALAALAERRSIR